MAKNSEKFSFLTELNVVDFESFESSGDSGLIFVNTEVNYLKFENNNLVYNARLSIEIITTNDDISWKIEVYKNGELFKTIDGKGTKKISIFDVRDNSANGVYNFKLSSTDYAGTSISISAIAETMFLSQNVYVKCSLSTTSKLGIYRYIPDMKITDFFSGILKVFNLTAYSENENVYNIEPLEDWYNAGKIRDITKYVNLDGEISRAPFYKVMNFQYEKSENLISRAFFDNFQREYGDLKYTFDAKSDGDEYTIKLPFENLMHQKFSGTKLHVGFCLKSDLKPYVPKPILLYKYGNISTDVNFYLEGSARTSYNAFGQDIEKVTGEFHTLNWGLENSTLLNGVVENTLFSDYYLRYLSNIYNRKSRIIKIEGVADTYLMSVLKLNDRVVIRDKRYVINNIQTELNTGKINLELLTDFRAI